MYYGTNRQGQSLSHLLDILLFNFAELPADSGIVIFNRTVSELDEHVFDVQEDLFLLRLALYLKRRKGSYISQSLPRRPEPILWFTPYRN